MPPPNNDQDKTEAPTPKKREDSRKKGQVAKSKDVSSVSVLFGSLLLLYFTANHFIQHILTLSAGIFSQAGELELNEANIYHFFLDVLGGLIIILFPLMVIGVVVGIGANLLQVGFLFTGEPILPKFSKINPFEGLKRIFSRQSLVEFLKSIFKIIIVGYVAFKVVRAEFPNIVPLMDMETSEILSYIGRISFKIILYTCLALVFLALFDYLFQKWEHERKLKMTKQEVKDEFRQREGDPLIKARIKSVQREMSRKRMMAEVPNADVVITNPDHYAIALGYDHGTMEAPQVLAKGAGFIAEQIKQIARKNKIPMVEDKVLARILFKTASIGQGIPFNLYKAVAEILAYVYRIKGKAP